MYAYNMRFWMMVSVLIFYYLRKKEENISVHFKNLSSFIVIDGCGFAGICCERSHVGRSRVAARDRHARGLMHF